MQGALFTPQVAPVLCSGQVLDVSVFELEFFGFQELKKMIGQQAEDLPAGACMPGTTEAIYQCNGVCIPTCLHARLMLMHTACAYH